MVFAIASEFVVVLDIPTAPLLFPARLEGDTPTADIPDCVCRSAALSICTPYVAFCIMRSIASAVNAPLTPFDEDADDAGRPLGCPEELGSTRSRMSR